MSSHYTVDLCDGFVKIGEVVAFRLSGRLRDLAAGSWQLDTDSESVGDVNLDLVDSIVVRDADTRAIVFAGIFRQTDDVAAFIRRRTRDGYQYTWSGTDVFGLLSSRLAYPDPTVAPGWGAASHDVNTGPASTVASNYIKDNIGSTALAARQIAGLTVTDPAVGSTLTWEARVLDLGKLVGDVCEAGDVTVDATYTGTNLSYVFRTPIDLSGSIILTDQADLEVAEIAESAPTGTYVIGAAQGEGVARTFLVADTAETGIDRVEYFYENTNISNMATLQIATDARSAQLADRIVVNAVAAAGAPNLPEWRTDYLLGDLLGVQIDGVRYIAPVTSVIMDITADRQQFLPVFGKGVADDLTKLVRKVATVEALFERTIQ